MRELSRTRRVYPLSEAIRPSPLASYSEHVERRGQALRLCARIPFISSTQLNPTNRKTTNSDCWTCWRLLAHLSSNNVASPAGRDRLATHTCVGHTIGSAVKVPSRVDSYT